MATYTVDLVVYGSTFPGLCLARYARAAGLSVVVLEWTKAAPGGMTTAGLTKTDVVGQPGTVRNTRWGRVLQFYKYIGSHAPWNYTDGREVINFNNSEGEAALNAIFLDDAQLVIRNNSRLKTVKKDPDTKKITSATLENGDVYVATYWADCSYEADLAAMAGVRMSSGRDSERKYREFQQEPDRDGERSGPGFHPRAVEFHNHKSVDLRGDRYPWRSMPPTPWTRPGDGASRNQAFGFRNGFSRAANRIPFSALKSPDFRAADYDWVVDAINNGGGAGGTFPLGISLYPGSTTDPADVGLPAGSDPSVLGLAGTQKFITNGGDIPQFSNGWETMTYAERDAAQIKAAWFCINCNYVGATDTRISQARRDAFNVYGYCADEFQSNFLAAPGWPALLYVRQCRNIVGQYVMTTHDMFNDGSNRNWYKPDSIGVGGYTIDAHAYYDYPLSNLTTQSEGKLSYFASGFEQYSIPLRACLPNKGDCANLVVGWGISGSTLFMNSYRMEPTAGVVCQSLGMLLGIAKASNRDINDVPYSMLRPLLLAEGAVLAI